MQAVETLIFWCFEAVVTVFIVVMLFQIGYCVWEWWGRRKR